MSNDESLRSQAEELIAKTDCIDPNGPPQPVESLRCPPQRGKNRWLHCRRWRALFDVRITDGCNKRGKPFVAVEVARTATRNRARRSQSSGSESEYEHRRQIAVIELTPLALVVSVQQDSRMINERTASLAPNRLRAVLRWIEHVLAVFGMLVILYWATFDYSEMVSDSMSPTLQGGIRKRDSVLTEKISYWFRRPRRWEVVTFRRDGDQIMKRVVGLPGEKVQMLSHGRLLIDGQEVTPPPELVFLKYFPYGNLMDEQAVDCKSGYFVLGDYSRDSDDSRFNGPLDPTAIIGRSWLILQPSDRRGFVR